ncbi:zinc-dependent alcohol dehydrogenase family protein [Halobacterium sp. KA-4]|uniref:zinc-dependent alcohol dehydrogenase family protein n=1 Tax=Halobacterium sp. KA-4 TaxID=2896367 RepID=UPI001E5EC2BB|nr:zinc-dependent alcohol dehydrogenase family protein [Halobacterium sp. KA-4]MCD2201212.1 zinc-dependent alcohol dehydrogenase family protein [Halobacterium sp. KA-4]
MRAAVLQEYGEPLVVEEVPDPDLDPHGVVVSVEACGICRSDWHAWKGHGEWADDQVDFGQILGHEPAGTVVEVGDDVDSVAVGDCVAVPFNLGEGACPQCRRGHGNVCEDGYALGFEHDAQGAFAERVHVPHADFNATVVPEDVPMEAVAALGCRYATAFHALAHRADVAGGDWVAIHGCGGLGLAGVQIATALGAGVVAVDVREEPLALAEQVGAVETVRSDLVESVPERIAALTDGGAHVSMDALGRAETCRNSVDCLRTRGTHVQVGLTSEAEKGEVSLPVDEITRWDISVLGSRGMPPSRYDELLRMIASDRLRPSELVTERVPLENVSNRLAAMTDYETSGIELVTEF